MTRFRPAPDNDNYIMETMFPETSFRTLESAVDFGKSTTDAVNETIGLHMASTTVRAAGGLVVAQAAGRLEVVSIPELSAAGEELRHVSVQILPRLGAYLQPHANEDEPADLADFWKSATSHYLNAIERRALGQQLIQVNYDMSTEFLTYSAGPFAEQ